MEITALLHRVRDGDRQALNEVIPLVYCELKKLASAHLRREGAQRRFDTTSLVHEAYLRLAGASHPDYDNHAHFYGVASRLMRQILVDAARARGAGKRGGGLIVAVAELPEVGVQPDETLLAMDEAIERLGKISPLKMQLIEMRYFSGMTAEESAMALSTSADVVRRELRLAQAWLRKEMTTGHDTVERARAG
jgi:RNA polymerase sigma-70 factor, ECF subfamily